MGAEPLDPAHHRRTGETPLADGFDDRLVQRLTVPGVGLPDEDPEQLPLAFEPRHSDLASTTPTYTAARPAAQEPSMFAAASA